MKLFTFTGETPAAALKKATEECGDNAFIVNTKELQKKTPSQAAIHEVVVAIDIEEAQEEVSPQKAPNHLPARSSNQPDLEDDVLLNLSETVKQITKIAQVTDEPYQPYRSQKATPKEKISSVNTNNNSGSPAETVPLKNIQSEISKLTDKVKLIQHMIWDQNEDTRSFLTIPPEFAEIYRIAKK